MNPVLGENVPLQIYKDGIYTDYACITDCGIEFTTDIKEVRTVGDGYHRKVRGQRLSYRVTGAGLIELQQVQPVAFWLLTNYQQQMLPVQFQMLFEDPVSALVKIVRGTALVTGMSVSAGSTGFALADFVMEGIGALEILDSATTCSATIGSLSFTAGDDPGEVVIEYSDVNVLDGGRLEYSVDGGSRLPIFDPGTDGEFTITGLTEGDHTVTVWAVCSTGVDGEENDLSFHVDEGGDPGDACAIPGDIALSDITPTSFRATWISASPVPGDGYAWELINYDTSTLVNSGTTAGTTIDNPGLTAGVTYQFRVRSVCVTGSSQSSFNSTFITLVAGCNVPGSPVMSLITETTATATWTAPSPAPGSGYEWELLNGVTVINTGTTGSLSVNLTGMPSGTSLTFQVKSICGVGSESGFNSVGFSTVGEGNNIDWGWIEDEGNGTLVIRVNGVDVVNETTAGAGNFTCDAGDSIQVFLTATTGTITVDDLTTSTQIVNESDSGITIGVFTTVSGHNYSINAEVTS